MSPSNKAQDVITDAAWYYENRGSITLIVWPERLSGTLQDTSYYSTRDGVLHLRIPSKMLLETLIRQGKAVPTKKPRKPGAALEGKR